MLIQFSVSNYRSFGEEVTLNMVASNKLTEHLGHRVPLGDITGKQLVRAALIYGANAAGKSNLVKAMAFAQRAIRGETPLSGLEPFRLSRGFAGCSTSFEFRFLAEGRIFTYGFDCTSKMLLAEWLTVLHNDEEVVVFERDKESGVRVGEPARVLFPNDPASFDLLNALAKIPSRADQLFLNRGAGVPEEALGFLLRTVLRWLTEDLVILQADHRAGDIIERVQRDKHFCDFSSKFLQRVGTGVSGLRCEETSLDGYSWARFLFDNVESGPDAGFPPSSAEHRPGRSAAMAAAAWQDTDLLPSVADPERLILRKLLAEHLASGDSYTLPFRDESDGTQQLLHLMPVLSNSPVGAKVVVIDELDRSLHPLVCWEFIRLFSESCAGAHKQLIVTTHEAHLLNQELLRRDEYWFVEKDATQQSRLIPLSDFNIRNDLQVQKGYLQGRFGAIPMIGSMESLEALLECKPSEGEHAAEEANAGS